MQLQGLIEVFLAELLGPCQVKSTLRCLQLLVDRLQVRRQLSRFNLVERVLELKLHPIDHRRGLALLHLEVEVVDVLRVERFYPFRYQQRLVQQLNLPVLLLVVAFS